MKNFNQLTEKQMGKVHGGFVGLILCTLAFVVAPLAVGGSVGYGAYEAVKQK